MYFFHGILKIVFISVEKKKNLSGKISRDKLFCPGDLLILIPLENLKSISTGCAIFAISRLTLFGIQSYLTKPMNKRRQITIFKLKLRNDVIIPAKI